MEELPAAVYLSVQSVGVPADHQRNPSGNAEKKIEDH